MAAAIAALLAPVPAASQRGMPASAGAGGVVGSVVDAVTGAPVGGATVVLQPDESGAFPGPASGAGFATATRAAVTDGAGAYRFTGLPPGVYRLYVTRVSYRPFSVIVELRNGEEPAVSVGLTAAPIRLEPLRGRSAGAGPYDAAYAFGDDVGLARQLVAHQRRRLYLTTDVRELTHADVVEGVTLGEPDVLRALQRLPGVTTRSDYTAELWTRGAPWSQTRVFYDGVPLFNPLHALGILSGIGSSAVGAVWFHPGVRSAAMAEGAAGVIDIGSRGATGAGQLNMRGDLSLMTAGVALDQRVLDGRAGWMLSGRHAYLGWLADLAGRAAGRDESTYPYGFSEVAGRVDARLSRSASVEASWLWEGDHLSSDPDSGSFQRSEWGNALARATLHQRLAGLDVRHTVAGSRNHGRVRDWSGSVAPASPAALILGESTIGFAALTGSIAPQPATLAGPAWSLGYALELREVDYHGPIPMPVPVFDRAMTLSDEGIGSTPVTDWGARLAMAAIWGERSWELGPTVSLRGGARLEVGDEVADVGALRIAPRLSLRYSPLPEVSFSVGGGRIYQYVQSVAPVGVHLASLVSTDAWMLAGPGVPPIRSDLLTAGFEAWLAPGRLATVNAFGRRATGMVMPDPRPGPLLERPWNVAATNEAVGLEVSVRQLTGPVTASVSYSLTRSRIAAAGLDFVTGADRTHVLDATLLARVLSPLRIGAAFTAATGVPFTRTIADEETCATVPDCDPEKLPWALDPNAARAPTYASLDLLADWSIRVRETEVGVYGQLRNVLGRRNATVYTGDGSACIVVGCGGADLHSAYERGIPRLPVIGVRVRR